MKKISIIGVGNVGGTLGRLWVEEGHEIRYGLRYENNPKFLSLKEKYPFKVHGRSVSELGDYSDIIVLAVPYSATKDLVPLLGDLDGKILVDTTNPIQPGFTGLSIGQTSSAAEEIQRLFPKARVVKAFNHIGMGALKNLNFNGTSADAFICGNDKQAKTMVSELAEDLGFTSLDVGDLSQARYLEPLAMLWITLANQYKFGTDIAFKLLRR
jgi:NADPH-dependent F420 reductase